MRLADLVATSRAVAESSSRLAKIAHLATLLEQLPPDEVDIAIAFLSGSTRQGRIGIGGSALSEARSVEPAGTASIELREVDAAFDQVARASGAGSNAARAERLRDLMRRAATGDPDFLVRLLFPNLRQGPLSGVMIKAVARPTRIADPPLHPAPSLARS